jgi:ABC-type nickel/cobalt efflux system permease component RcnA
LLMVGLLLFSLGYFFLKENLNNSDNLLILITIVFGLIHGFGFGGFLLNTEINSNNILSGLLGFNLGVEFGQILFVSGVLLIFQLVNFVRLNFIINLFKDTSFALLICFGLYFFIQRLMI